MLVLGAMGVGLWAGLGAMACGDGSCEDEALSRGIGGRFWVECVWW